MTCLGNARTFMVKESALGHCIGWPRLWSKAWARARRPGSCVGLKGLKVPGSAKLYSGLSPDLNAGLKSKSSKNQGTLIKLKFLGKNRIYYAFSISASVGLLKCNI